MVFAATCRPVREILLCSNGRVEWQAIHTFQIPRLFLLDIRQLVPAASLLRIGRMSGKMTPVFSSAAVTGVRLRTRDCAGDHCTKSAMTRSTDRKPTAVHSTGGPTHLVQLRATDFTVPLCTVRVPESAFHPIPAERDFALLYCAPSFGAARVARVSDTVTLSAPNEC